MRACVYAISIVSTDKILLYKYLIILLLNLSRGYLDFCMHPQTCKNVKHDINKVLFPCNVVLACEAYPRR